MIVFVPHGKMLVSGGVQVTAGLGSQLSVTIGSGMLTGVGPQLVTVMSCAQVITGGVVSFTSTLKQQSARETPALLSSLQQTLVGPKTMVPGGGSQTTLVCSQVLVPVTL